MTQKSFNTFTWSLFGLSVVLPLLAWGGRLDWQLGSLDGYQWFPLLGMLAWMVMWGHFVTGAVRVKNPELQKPAGYSAVSGWLVLGCLFLHPGILALEQSRNGAGTPPQSFIDYAGQNLRLAVMLGSVALVIFLSFEIFDRVKNNQLVKKWWWVVSVSQILAMILIFVHALRLGSDVTSGWFRVVWIIYGIILVPSFYIILNYDFAARPKETVSD